MRDDFASIFKLAMRQAFRFETVALALVQLLLLALVNAFARASFYDQISLTCRAAADLAIVWLLFGFVLTLFGMSLMSRLNGRVFGRPFPANTLRAAWRHLRALLAQVLIALAIVLPIFLAVLAILGLATGEVSGTWISLWPAGFALVLLYLILIRYLLLPIMTIYDGELSLSRSRARLRERHWPAVGVPLALGFIFIVVSALASWAAGSFMHQEFAAVIALATGALAYGPLTIAVSALYFAGTERMDGWVR